MTELSFVKQFLTALDSRPIKLSSDHIADARQYPAQNAYTLPRLPSAHPTRPTRKSTTSASGGLSVLLKPLKSSQATITLPAQALSTSIYDLKSAYAAQTSIPIPAIKVLYKKKPVPDSKTLSEIIGSDGAQTGLEFGVMILGGATAGTPATTPPVEVPQPSMRGAGEKELGAVTQGSSGKDELKTEAFWDDLKGFLVQRVRDEGEGERLTETFRGVWEKEQGR